MVKTQDLLKNNPTCIEIPAGTPARKGSIAATILNAKELDMLLKMPPSTSKRNQIAEVIQDIKLMLPSLHAVNLFQFFTPLEWLQDPNREGRCFVALLYLQSYPHLIDRNIQARLAQIKLTASTELKAEIERMHF